mmetsp:Transcript_3565/g.8470  ORF Transcript_3565/g.8470 Transcript_3565/m.8470 type:complete len:217 (+) Transcript_3565:533-1183(+)
MTLSPSVRSRMPPARDCCLRRLLLPALPPADCLVACLGSACHRHQLQLLARTSACARRRARPRAGGPPRCARFSPLPAPCGTRRARSGQYSPARRSASAPASCCSASPEPPRASPARTGWRCAFSVRAALSLHRAAPVRPARAFPSTVCSRLPPGAQLPTLTPGRHGVYALVPKRLWPWSSRPDTTGTADPARGTTTAMEFRKEVASFITARCRLI